MGKADRMSSIFWLVFSLFGSIESYRIGPGTLHKPGSGFQFFWTSMFLGILPQVIFIRTWHTEKAREAEIRILRKVNFAKIIVMLISAFVYVLLMETMGFISVILLFFIFVLEVIKKEAWLLTIFLSIR